MNKTKIINYKGQNIFFMDFSASKTQDDVAKVIEESIAYIQKQPIKSVVALTNMENIFFNNNVKNNFIQFLKGNKAHIKTSALYGMSGLARILFNGIMKITGREIRSFETKTEAKDFLINACR